MRVLGSLLLQACLLKGLCHCYLLTTTYINPNISLFNFLPLVVHFLQILQVTPQGLHAIGATQDYELASWRGCFISTGLSEEDAERLEQVFLVSVSREQRDVLCVVSKTLRSLVPSIPCAAQDSLDTISSVSSLGDAE